jgi:hypothetical protein
MSPLRAAVLLVPAAVLVAGCLPEQGLDTAALETELGSRVSMEDDSKTLVVECDGGLEAEDGATQDCHVSSEGEVVGIQVTTTDPRSMDFDMEAFLDPEAVEESMMSTLEEQGRAPQDVACDGELVGEVGASQTCTVTMADRDLPVTATVTSVDGLVVNFDFESS